MIFDYMDHDMTGLLDRTRDARRFTAAQVQGRGGVGGHVGGA